MVKHLTLDTEQSNSLDNDFDGKRSTTKSGWTPLLSAHDKGSLADGSKQNMSNCPFFMQKQMLNYSWCLKLLKIYYIVECTGTERGQ